MQKAARSSSNTIQHGLTGYCQLSLLQQQHRFTATVNQRWLSSTPGNNCFFDIHTSTEQLLRSQTDATSRSLYHGSRLNLSARTYISNCKAYKRTFGCTQNTESRTKPGLLSKTINHQEKNQ